MSKTKKTLFPTRVMRKAAPPWTVRHLELMLHIHATAEPLPKPKAPATVAFLKDLLAAGLITKDSDPLGSGYASTKRGSDYVDALKRTALPHA